MAFVSKIEKVNFIDYEIGKIYQIEAWGHPNKNSYYSLLAVYTPKKGPISTKFKILSLTEEYKLTGYHQDQIFIHEGILPTKIVITKLS